MGVPNVRAVVESPPAQGAPVEAFPDSAPSSSVESEVALGEPYNVLLWNDPVTLMDIVVRALKKIFGYGPEKAEQLMMTAHLEGKAVVWTGSRDQATRYCLALGRHGLQSTVARAG